MYMDQVVSITSQGQISIPAMMRRALSLNKYNKANVRLDKKRIIIEPLPDIMELEGSLHAYAIKNKPIEEIMKLEEEAMAKAIAANYRKSRQ